MSANIAHHSYESAYAYRVKTDSKGHEHIQILVPSARGMAWTPLPSKFEQPHLYEQEVMEVLLDPGQLPEWKILILSDIYLEFRASENRRKRKESSYSDEPEPATVNALEAAISIDVQAQVIQDDEVARILAMIPSEKVRARVEAHVLDGATFKEIALVENPHATDNDLKRGENSVGRSVKRALKTLATQLDRYGMSGFGQQ